MPNKPLFVSFRLQVCQQEFDWTPYKLLSVKIATREQKKGPAHLLSSSLNWQEVARSSTEVLIILPLPMVLFRKEFMRTSVEFV